jgi:hypothetical protein
MSAGTVRGTDARAFVKAFNGICNWNGFWERWNDMVNLFAIELVNAVDLNNRDKREKDYIRIRDRYKPDEFSRFGEVFCLLVESLERNPFQDFLGGMYMELNMGSKAHGQCFTPFGVCQAMAAMAMPEEQVRQQLDERGWISINDCACGAGATLIAAAERLYQMGINYQQSALFVAGDIDNTVAMMCFIQLALIGCAGRIRIGDTLTDPETGPLLIGDGGPKTWYLPMFYDSVWCGRVFAWRMDRILQGFREGQPATPEVIPKKIKPEEPKMPETALELVTAKRTKRSMSEGQLMFDLTGGM